MSYDLTIPTLSVQAPGEMEKDVHYNILTIPQKGKGKLAYSDKKIDLDL